MAQLASDDFNRADNADLGANWSRFSTWEAMVIASNHAKYAAAASGLDSGEYYNAAADIANGYVEATLGTTEAGGVNEGFGVLWCASTSAMTGYRLVGNGSGWELTKWSSGSDSSLSSPQSGTTFAAGDVLRLEFNSGAWTVKKNGSTVTNGTGTDGTPLSAAKPGLCYSSTDASSAGINAWAYGDLTAAVESASIAHMD